MNKELTIKKELWPNNGTIIIEFNDLNLKLNDTNSDTLDFSYIDRFIVIDTINEDDLEWEKEYVLCSLSLKTSVMDYEKKKHEYMIHWSILGENQISIENTTRIALSEAFDWIFTNEEGFYIDFNEKFNFLKFSIFSNKDKTDILFLGLLMN